MTSANIWTSLYSDTKKEPIIKIKSNYAKNRKNCSIYCIIFIKIIVLNGFIFNIIASTISLIILDYKIREDSFDWDYFQEESNSNLPY